MSHHSEIDFFSERTEMPPLNYDKVREWIGLVAETHDREVGRLNYIFVNDKRILEVNREFLRHDYFTDIITFDYSRRRRISGDMYISLETVGTNADQIGASKGRELLRVIIHGVLHLVGINDKGPGEREIMESHEDRALELWDQINR